MLARLRRASARIAVRQVVKGSVGQIVAVPLKRSVKPAVAIAARLSGAKAVAQSRSDEFSIQRKSFSTNTSKNKCPNEPVRAKVTFEDVGISDKIKDDLKEAIDILKNNAKAGSTLPKGIILSGPPGTGKSMFAEAIAGEAGVDFFLVSCSELLGEIVGQGERLIKELFEKVREHGRCVVCLDEIDSIATKRFGSPRYGSEHHVNTLTNQLLTVLSANNGKALIVATTNDFNKLDSAVVRPGRFDKHIIISLPDIELRKKILSIQLKNKMASKNFSIDTLAKLSVGFSGAKLSLWVKDAMIIATRKEAMAINMSHFDEARMILQEGIVREIIECDELKRRIAIHEAGHAYVGQMLGMYFHRASVKKGISLGYTEFLNYTNEINPTKNRMLDYICQSLAGRAAESIYDCVQMGSSKDIEKAESLAKDMVLREGMGSTVTGLNAALDVEKIIQEQLARATNLLKGNTKTLDQVIYALREHNELDREQFLNIVQQKVFSSNPRESFFSYAPPNERMDFVELESGNEFKL